MAPRYELGPSPERAETTPRTWANRCNSVPTPAAPALPQLPRPRPSPLSPCPLSRRHPTPLPRERGTRLERSCCFSLFSRGGGCRGSGEEGRGDEGLGRGRSARAETAENRVAGFQPVDLDADEPGLREPLELIDQGRRLVDGIRVGIGVEVPALIAEILVGSEVAGNLQCPAADGFVPRLGG